MARITVARTIDLYYQSPSEMIDQLAGPLAGEAIGIDSPMRLQEGAVVDVTVHVPMLGRQVRLRGKVQRCSETPSPPGFLLCLLDGPFESIEQLRELVGRLKSGAILEEISPDQPPEQRIRAMAPSLRAMLAARATAEERAVLARDTDPRVVDGLLKNPSITMEEVRRLAMRLTLNHGHFALISRNPAWMGDEMVRTSLARNPRLPEFMADLVLQLLSTATLKSIVESMNTTASTRRSATRILQTRGIVVSARRGTIT